MYIKVYTRYTVYEHYLQCSENSVNQINNMYYIIHVYYTMYIVSNALCVLSTRNKLKKKLNLLVCTTNFVGYSNCAAYLS